jgi:hypothetical protein
MKNRIGILVFFILLFAPVGLSQFTTTANLGFRKPNQGITTNWNVYINGNFDELDSILSGFSILTSNSPTPSVLNSSHWTADNSVPTIITNFTGGYSGQLITVLCQDTVTVINLSSSINVNGSFNCTTGISISLILINSIWIETARVQFGGSSIDTALLSGSNTYTGNNTFLGSTSLKTVNNGAILFADQFLNVQAAISACPSTGCTVYANSPIVNLNLGNIDPGDGKNVWLYLGPYTYSLTQLKLRSSMHVFGAGDQPSNTSNSPMTVLQCTTNATPCIVLGTGTAPYPVAGVVLDGFRLYGAPANTSQIGMDIIAGAGGGGMWYSTFRNLYVALFAGQGIVFDGTAGGSPNGVNQFNDFISVKAFRTAGGGSAFLAEGQNAQFTFRQVEFDGQSQSDSAAPNIWLGDGVTGLTTPLTTFLFDELTCQTSAVCVSLNGAWKITFKQPHIEQISTVFQMNAGAVNGNIAVDADAGYYAVNTGINAGSGSIVNMVSGTNSFNLLNSYIVNAPDNYCVGTGCTVGFNAINNVGTGGNNNQNVPSLNRIPSTLQVVSVQSSLGGNLTAGNIALSSGFGTGALINNMQTPSTQQTAYFNIVTGTSTGVNPTVTVTFPNGFNNPVLCTLDYHGGTHPFATFNQVATVAAGSAEFVFNGTPTASTFMSVFMRCGP